MYHDMMYKDAVKKTNSKDENNAVEGIKMLRESGKPEAVEIVVEILEKGNSRLVQNECIKFLNDIKDQKAVPYLVGAMKKEIRKSTLKDLVSSAWQNNLDYSDHLELFADISLNEEYIVAYEAFTVIENHIDRVSPETADLIQEKIKMGRNTAQREKQPMLEELLQIINDLKNN